MSQEPPWKRARSCVAAGRAAIQLGLSGDASKFAEAARSAVESAVALREALEGVAVLSEQQLRLDSLRSRAHDAEEEVRQAVKRLSAAEETLQRLELLASGTMTALCGDAAASPITTGLQPVSLKRLVQFARQASYSTAAPPLTPAGPISLMPLAPMMRMSTLYTPVPLLSDPTQPEVRAPAPKAVPVQAVPRPTQSQAAAKPMPDNLDLDLEDSAADSSDESSSEAESSSSSEQEEAADEW